LWNQAAKDLGFSSEFSRELKKLWNTWIRPMEDYLAMIRDDELQDQPVQMKQMKQMKPVVHQAKIDTSLTLTEAPANSNEGHILVINSAVTGSEDFLQFCKAFKVPENSIPRPPYKYLSFFEDLRPPFQGL
jgi:hypothetical protein